MKPGDLERTLSRLLEMAKAAQEHLASADQGLLELRRELQARPREDEPEARTERRSVEVAFK